MAARMPVAAAVTEPDEMCGLYDGAGCLVVHGTTDATAMAAVCKDSPCTRRLLGWRMQSMNA